MGCCCFYFNKIYDKKEDLRQIKKYLLNIIQEIYGEDLYCCSYIKYWYNDFLSDNEIENISDPYETLKRLVNQKMIRYFDLDTELRNNEFKGIRLNGIEDNIMESFDILPKQFLIRCNIVAKSSNRLKRMMLNAIYSKIFKVDISDDISIHSYNKKEIRYGELRTLVYLRNNLCDADQFLNGICQLSPMKIYLKLIILFLKYLRYIKGMLLSLSI